MQLGAFLHQLQLEQYHEALIAQGFDSCQDLISISEDDLEKLDFKLGHRRKLQRAIATLQGKPRWEPLSADGTSGDSQGLTVSQPSKRRYHKRPPKDPHAPQRPQTGYVLFSNFMRQNSLVSDLSFVQIAKLVGEQWARLLPEERQTWISRAEGQMSIYETKRLRYEQTEDYQRHQSILVFFKKNEAARASRRNDVSTNPSASSLDGSSTSPGASMYTTPRTDNSGSESTPSRFTKSVDIPHSLHSTSSSTSRGVLSEVRRRDSLYPVLDRNWNSVLSEPQMQFSSNPADIVDAMLALRIGQNSAEFTKRYLQDHSPFSADSAIDVRRLLDMFLQRVNTSYHLVDAGYIVQQFRLATETVDALSNSAMYTLCFCVSIACQMFDEDGEESSLVWHEYGLRYLDANDWDTNPNIAQALALIGMFHVNLRPATAQRYLGIALQVENNQIVLRDIDSDPLTICMLAAEREAAAVSSTIGRMYSCLDVPRTA